MTASPLLGSTFFGLDLSQMGEKLVTWRRRVSKRVLLLEFASESLRLAEAVHTPSGIQLNHLSAIQLPPEALERGVPADPAKMASLIRDFCSEKKIPAHRVAVVLTPEIAFQRIVELPAELSIDEARSFILDPTNGLQIPFPLMQTDYDLVPIDFAPCGIQPLGNKPYMLSAIPQVLVDRVIEMLDFADLELQILELGSISQLRCLALDLVMLGSSQVELVIELLHDVSNLMFVASSGLLGMRRLAAIRDFPQPSLDADQTSAALSAGLTAEAHVIQDENYLPLSDLDLRVLVSDIRSSLLEFHQTWPGAEICSLQLTGINSAHPLLADLLADTLKVPVSTHHPLLSPGLAGFALDELLLQSSLGRLAGLGLALLPQESLVTCPINSDSMSQRSAKTGLPLDQLLVFDQAQILGPASSSTAIDTALLTSESTVVVKALDAETDFVPHIPDTQIASNDFGITADEMAESLVDEREQVAEVLTQVEDEEWPSIGGLVDPSVDESVEVAEVLTQVEDEEWPTIGGLKDPSVDESVEVTEVLTQVEDEEWPSIGGLEDPSADESVEVTEVLTQVEDEEWPSIGGLEDPSADESIEVTEVLTQVEDEEWPSIPKPTGPSSIANPSPFSNQEVPIDQFKISSRDPSGSSGDILSADQNLDSGSKEQISAGVSSSQETTFVETSPSTISPPEHGELVIPGLDSLNSLPTEPDQNKNAQSEAVPLDDLDESSFEGLGKLRFAGDDE